MSLQGGTHENITALGIRVDRCFSINTKLWIISEKFQGGLQHTFFAYAVEEPTVSVIICQGNSGGNIVSSEQLAQFLYRRRLDLYTIAFNFFPTIYYSKFQT